VEAVTDTALLLDGPLDTRVVDLDSPALRLVFPRFRDDGTLVMDVYFHASTRLHGQRVTYRYEGEEVSRPADRARVARPVLTRRERFRDFRDGLRELLADLRGKP
jgi:hypothetical protein